MILNLFFALFSDHKKGVWEFVFPASHTAKKSCSITHWVTPTCVQTTFTFNEMQVSKDLLHFECGNSSKDSE